MEPQLLVLSGLFHLSQRAVYHFAAIPSRERIFATAPPLLRAPLPAILLPP
jgi:hypothetical protein